MEWNEGWRTKDGARLVSLATTSHQGNKLNRGNVSGAKIVGVIVFGNTTYHLDGVCCVVYMFVQRQKVK
jgi:hypothetical protein